MDGNKLLDDIDSRIVVELQQDADKTNIALANELGVSEATIRRRVQALKSTGIIKVVAVPQPAKIGYHVATILCCETTLGKAEKVADALASYENTVFVGTATGRFDVIAWGAFSSPSDLSDFLTKTLPTIDGLVSTETYVILSTKKLAYTLTPKTGYDKNSGQ